MWSLLVAALTAVGAALAPAPPPSLADLPGGDAPQVGYVDTGTWHGPAGRRVALPDRHGISAVAPLGDAFVVFDTRIFEGSVGAVRTDPPGSWTASGSPTVAADGRVAWTSFIAPESGLTGPSLVHVDGATLPWAEPGAVFSAAGFAGRSVVVTGYLTTHLLHPDGTRTRVPRLGSAYDASGRLVAGELGRGAGVVDARTGEVRWRGAGHLHTFSPTGRRVAVLVRDRVVSRRASDGRMLWQQRFRGYVGDLAWESDGSVLAVVVQREQAAVVRFTGDGVERATRVAAYDVNRPSLVLGSD